MKHAFQFEFDVPLIKAGIRRDLMWKGYLMASVMLVAAIAARVSYGYWDPVLTGVLILGAIVIVWRFHGMLNRFASQIFELWSTQSPSGVMRFELNDDGFSVVLDKSRSDFEWAGLRRLWRYDDVWLIEIVKGQSVFFPPDRTSDEVRDYLVERCRSANVRTE